MVQFAKREHPIESLKRPKNMLKDPEKDLFTHGNKDQSPVTV